MGAMGRVAVVTGAASGMGLAIARHLAARGDRVGLLDLQGDAAVRAAEELRATGATAIGVEADVTDRGAVDAALVEVRAELGPIEIMVTAAGLDSFEPFTSITIESWERSSPSTSPARSTASRPPFPTCSQPAGAGW